MLRFRLGANNIYIKTGLVLLAVAVLCFAYTFGSLPTVGLVPSLGVPRMLEVWITMASFIGGLVLYFIGRIAYALRVRGQ